eukprot:NODE_2541_length_1152_cov_16.912195_g2422_i0.p1 GENE.NODE_2541_length_1152_cov_16.912195_g2422_i0~~NODE_2541_length_1152_cov_16.912195_g2422_i0.p1  ORF type:complete len:325 (-),score=100.14 NODE_2541_length_1152_cov_16.912195_g2422_i0:177-1100(-)
MPTLVQSYTQQCKTAGVQPRQGVLEGLQGASATQLRLHHVDLEAHMPTLMQAIDNSGVALETLAMPHSNISDRTLRPVCQYLVTHSKLHSIDLSGNPITEAGGELLLTLVQNSPQITHVVLRHTDIPPALIARIDAACSLNSTQERDLNPRIAQTSSPLHLADPAPGTSQPRGSPRFNETSFDNSRLSATQSLTPTHSPRQGSPFRSSPQGPLNRTRGGMLDDDQLTVTLKTLHDKLEQHYASPAKAFRVFDAQRSGILERTELLRLLRDFNLGIEEGQLEGVVARLDLDQDGQVSFADFVNAMGML